MTEKVLILWGSIGNQRKSILKSIVVNALLKSENNSSKYKLYFESTTDKKVDIVIDSSEKINNISISHIIDSKGHIINAERLNQYHAIFVLAELNWYKNKLADFFGLTIVKNLRLGDIKCPIFICSFMSFDYLFKKEQNQILGFRGHYFIQLPENFTENAEIEALDNLELLDCKMHYCGIEGSIREILHRKQHILSESNLNIAKDKLISLLNEINSLNGLPEYLRPVIKDLIKEVEVVDSFTKLKVFISADETKILAHLKEQDKDGITNPVYVSIKGDWRILILEDVIKDIELLLKSLKDAGIKEINILHAESYNDAKEKIEKDKGNKIAVVICDYRLQKEGKVKGKQGYSFVQWLSKQDRYNAVFVYSGLARRFLKETFKKYNIRVTVNSKYEITDKMSNFVDEVIEKGNEVNDLIINRPTTPAWREMELYYQQYRLWSGYDKMEEEINETARNIIKQINQLRESIQQYDLKDKTSLYQIPKLPNISARLFKSYNKTEFENNPELKNKFCEDNVVFYEDINKYYCFPTITDKKNIEYLKVKLIARRVAWWLLMCEGIHLNTVYALLSHGELVNWYFRIRGNTEGYNSSSKVEIHEISHAKTLINTRLAVIKEDFPHRLLVEEKNWFKYDMSVDLEDLMSVFNGFEHYFIGFFEQFTYRMMTKSKYFKELEDRYMDKVSGNFCFYSANDIRKAVELSLNCLTEQGDKIDLITKVLTCFNKSDLVCEPYFRELENYCKNQLYILNKKQ